MQAQRALIHIKRDFQSQYVKQCHKHYFHGHFLFNGYLLGILYKIMKVYDNIFKVFYGLNIFSQISDLIMILPAF